ncbi:hypothetical protein WMF39_14175 [Sorangium sp. So ce1504]|uniref:hypothetical protein n=1 Tax=Sorangium sp. So ce1504 TaxID=3133337 RepID=UPI003F62A243
MISVAVRVETECGTCRMPMPVNTLAREVGCQSCGRPNVIEGELWQALFREPLYRGPGLLVNEDRRSSAGKLAVAYTRRSPSCQGCDEEIPIASVQEVRGQATLRCNRCAKQTWVRAVPAELVGALPNITHLVGEGPDPIAVVHSPQAEVATFPCPQCGSPTAFDGVNRVYTCRFCTASVHVPDEFVYRGQRRVLAPWYLCFHSSITERTLDAQAASAGLFDWEMDLPDAIVDAEGNLYCATSKLYGFLDENREPASKIEYALWSLDNSLNIRWIRRDRSGAVRFMFCVGDRLLLIDAESSSPLWLSSATGMPVEPSDVTAPAPGTNILLHLPREARLTCDRDGSLLLLKYDRIRRMASSGAELPVWPEGAPRIDDGEDSGWDWHRPTDRPLKMDGSVDAIHCGPDGSLYMLHDSTCGMLARFDAEGRKVYCVELPDEALRGENRVMGVDLHGNAYVLRHSQLLRVDATGKQSVVLHSYRDALPQLTMSIAVCPDGSFWLFGVIGFAWKFDPEGKLLFASKEEPGAGGGKMDVDTAARIAQIEELRALSLRRAEDVVRSAKEERDRRDKIGCVYGAVLLTVMLLFYLWLFLFRARG